MSDPLVSIIVRSMGRTELRAALASIAAQDYPRIEIIVVDATGGGHPPLPEIGWRQGHLVRKVGGTRRLPRPAACNVGLAAVTGQWFGFLDDDDTFLPDHVSALIDATRANPEALLVYGRSNMLGNDGEIEKVFGSPFNRAAMYYGPLFYWQASLISSRVRDLGCRFDEALDVCEDRDFLNQIAEHADFTFVPIVTFNYRPDAGTSGTGRGPNRNTPRLHYFDGLLRAKWAGQCEYHTTRVTRGVRDAILAYHRGAFAESRTRLAKVLREYPDDPSALHAVARLDLEAGRLAEAEAGLRRALEISPGVAEFRCTQASVLFGLGRHEEARRAASLAVQDPRFGPAMQALLARLPRASAAPPAAVGAATTSRNQACGCGSGKRYKHCCGLAAPPRSMASAARAFASNEDRAVAEAAGVMELGEASLAARILGGIDAGRLLRADSAVSAASVYRELGELERERAFLARALELDEQPATVLRFDACVGEIFSDISLRSLRQQIERLVERLARRARIENEEPPAYHVLCDFQVIGGGENRALRIFEFVSQLGSSRLWSLSEPSPFFRQRAPEVRVLDVPGGAKPTGGTLIIVGNYWGIETLTELTSDCGRLILGINTAGPDNLKNVVKWLTLLDAAGHGCQVDFVFPSRMWRDRVGLDGFVEYPPIDPRKFSPAAKPMGGAGPLTVGRLCRRDKLKFHPGDPALIRRIVAQGHRCRIMDGTLLKRALSGSARAGAIDLLPLDAEDARTFLASLDVFLYWKHPLLIETGGTVLLEAMAMAIPVIVIGEQVGVAELIENGVDGFLAKDEVEALVQLSRLAASPELRLGMGRAARRKVVATMDGQLGSLRSFYLGGRLA